MRSNMDGRLTMNDGRNVQRVSHGPGPELDSEPESLCAPEPGGEWRMQTDSRGNDRKEGRIDQKVRNSGRSAKGGQVKTSNQVGVSILSEKTRRGANRKSARRRDAKGDKLKSNANQRRSTTTTARERRRQDLGNEDDGYSLSSIEDQDIGEMPGAVPVPGIRAGGNQSNFQSFQNEDPTETTRSSTAGEEDSGVPVLSATLVGENGDEESQQEEKVLATAMPVTWKSTMEDKRVCLLFAAVLLVAVGLSLGLGLSLNNNGANSSGENLQTQNQNIAEQPTPPPTSPSPTSSPSQEPSLTPSISLAPSQSPTLTPIDAERAIWIPIGGDLNGQEYSGAAVSLSGDGFTLAVGNLGDSEKGKVEIYQRNGNVAWSSALSNSIGGKAVGDGCCRAIALSQDGLTVAVGAHLSDQAGTDFGRVQVYRWSENFEWNPLGDPIWGSSGVEWAGEVFGYSVSLSSGGSILAVGAPQAEGNEGATFGETRVYQYDEVMEKWKLFGQVLDDGGCYQYGEFGRSVSLSSDGTTLAVGAPQYDSPYDHVGQVQIFSFDSDLEQWKRIGGELFGEARLDRSGTSVALSGDGQTVAIGGPGNDVNKDLSVHTDPGHVRVYRRFGDDWAQIGQDIDGKLDDGGLGSSVAISDDGAIIAVGAPGNGTGYAQVYHLHENGNWEQIGVDLQGESAGDEFGTSVSLSSNGRVLAIGAPKNQEGRGTPNGHVRVFRLDHQD